MLAGLTEDSEREGRLLPRTHELETVVTSVTPPSVGTRIVSNWFRVAFLRSRSSLTEI